MVAMLPGALYVWAFERQAGRYGIGLSDRVLRFVGGSAVFLAVFAGPLYALHVRFTADLLAAEPLPSWLVAFPLAYVDGWIRCRLRSGTWLGGAYADANGRRSYAAGYPEPQDLYLAASVEVDPTTGEFVLDEAGQPRLGAGGLLIRWEEVEYLEFIDSSGRQKDGRC